jgi:hypothetical protein
MKGRPSRDPGGNGRSPHVIVPTAPRNRPSPTVAGCEWTNAKHRRHHSSGGLLDLTIVASKYGKQLTVVSQSGRSRNRPDGNVYGGTGMSRPKGDRRLLAQNELEVGSADRSAFHREVLSHRLYGFDLLHIIFACAVETLQLHVSYDTIMMPPWFRLAT